MTDNYTDDKPVPEDHPIIKGWMEFGEHCAESSDMKTVYLDAFKAGYNLAKQDIKGAKETIRCMEIDKETIRKDANRLLADQQAKIEKLMGLLEKEFRWGMREMYTSEAAINHRWQQYKTDNDL